MILPTSDYSQIGDPIVVFVPVNMVNLTGIFTIDDQPCQTMGSIGNAIDANADVSAGYRSCRFTGVAFPDAFAQIWAFTPDENAGVRIVIQCRSDGLDRRQWFADDWHGLSPALSGADQGAAPARERGAAPTYPRSSRSAAQCPV